MWECKSKRGEGYIWISKKIQIEVQIGSKNVTLPANLSETYVSNFPPETTLNCVRDNEKQLHISYVMLLLFFEFHAFIICFGTSLYLFKHFSAIVSRSCVTVAGLHSNGGIIVFRIDIMPTLSA